MSELLEKPEPPGAYDCCENGCSPCVWDVYSDKLTEWKRRQAELKAQAEKEAEADEQ